MVETDYESEGKALMSEPVIDYPINLNSKTDVITKTTYLLVYLNLLIQIVLS